MGEHLLSCCAVLHCDALLHSNAVQCICMCLFLYLYCVFAVFVLCIVRLLYLCTLLKCTTVCSWGEERRGTKLQPVWRTCPYSYLQLNDEEPPKTSINKMILLYIQLCQLNEEEPEKKTSYKVINLSIQLCQLNSRHMTRCP